MKKRIEFRPIGEEFQLFEVKLKVVNSVKGSCLGCFFYAHDRLGCHRLGKYNTGACSTLYRKDGKSIVFKNVTNDGCID